MEKMSKLPFPNNSSNGRYYLSRFIRNINYNKNTEQRVRKSLVVYLSQLADDVVEDAKIFEVVLNIFKLFWV